MVVSVRFHGVALQCSIVAGVADPVQNTLSYHNQHVGDLYRVVQRHQTKLSENTHTHTHTHTHTQERIQNYTVFYATVKMT